jgi:hypothetical protein
MHVKGDIKIKIIAVEINALSANAENWASASEELNAQSGILPTGRDASVVRYPPACLT